MGSGFLMGLVAGALVGAMAGSFTVALAAMLVGSIGGAVYGAHRAGRAAGTGPRTQNEAWLISRVEALERRVAQLESERDSAMAPTRDSATVPERDAAMAPERDAAMARTRAAETPLLVRTTTQIPERIDDPNVPPPAPAYRVGTDSRGPAQSWPWLAAETTEVPAARGALPGGFARALGWLGGGNALTRIGVVVLFFGVAFLLSHFAELVTIPIEVKLGAALVAGVALTLAGVVVARRRPGYGLSLQGAGMGIAYLTVFAAFRLYDVLAPATGVAVLMLITAVTIALAWRGDSQALATLAVAGGFLAPFLIPTDVASPGLLFGYFAILNLVGFVLAWGRAWRVLDIVGFVFTLALGFAWGYRFYSPAHYAVVQTYLVLFFLFFVGVTLLHARSGRTAPAAIDGVMVFGVPVAAFAMQMPLVEGWRYGVATSALVLAVFYAVLWVLVRRRDASLQRLAIPFAGLALAFATLSIPFAFDPRTTAAWWAVEGAAVYALGVAQRRQAARAFALALQVGAALAFAWDTPRPTGTPFLNAAFLGMMLIGLAAWASAWIGDRAVARAPDRPAAGLAIGPREQSLLPWMVAWGLGWWLAAGITEAHVRLPRFERLPGSLLWVASSGVLGLCVARVLRWPRIGWIAAAVFPAMVAILAVAIRDDFALLRSPIAMIAWLVAWIAHGLALRALDRAGWTAAEGERGRVRLELASVAHAATALFAVAWLGWELYSYADRVAERGSVWRYCALAWPAIAYLFAVRVAAGRAGWPLAAHADDYVRKAGSITAGFLSVFVLVAAVTLHGDAPPFRYLPLLNPLELTLVAAVVALWRFAPLSPWSSRWRIDVLAATMFVVLSSMVARAVHHLAGVRWNVQALWADRVLQASLTLTWTTMALFLMLRATRVGSRVWWMAGAALLGVVVAKLFLVDLAALSGWPRVVAFLGTGVILLALGYLAPLPPAAAREETRSVP